MLISEKGVVLKQRKIAGNRRILVVLTSNRGKLQIGTGANENGKNKAALFTRPFTFANYSIFFNKGYYNLNSADVIKSYYKIGEDINRFLAASDMLDYVDLISPEEVPKNGIFNLVIEFLENISEAKSGYAILLYSFIIKSFRIEGIMPEITLCTNCGKKVSLIKDEQKQINNFSIENGGILCQNCYNELKKSHFGDDENLILSLDFDIVDTIKYLMENRFSQFKGISVGRETSLEIKRFLSEYARYYMNIDIFGSNFEI